MRKSVPTIGLENRAKLEPRLRSLEAESGTTGLRRLVMGPSVSSSALLHLPITRSENGGVDGWDSPQIVCKEMLNVVCTTVDQLSVYGIPSQAIKAST